MYLFLPLNEQQCQYLHPSLRSQLVNSLLISIASKISLCGFWCSCSFDLFRSLALEAPNMEAITASLERSLQNCSLNNNNNHHENTREDGSGTDAGIGISSSSDDVPDNNHISNSDTTLELNSHISLPYHWEQCLDLKTGEIYYINWRNGMKAKEDPRRAAEYSTVSRDCESEEESWYDSEESSSESCPSSSKEHYQGQVQGQGQGQVEKQNVLVVAGCKACLMYFMVPKQVEDCPKCSGQLLHFDRSENGSP
ncbi:hypothetical protein CR513_48359, partial [Mucuna pruriens]